MSEGKRGRGEQLVSIGVELAMLALVWRALEGPDPRELARELLEGVRRRIDSQLSYRRAMLDTLEDVRRLPETEEGER